MSEKVRVHEIAKELGITSKEVVEKASAMGLAVKTASSSVSVGEAEKIMDFVMNGPAVEEVAKPIIIKKKKVETPAEEAPTAQAEEISAPETEEKATEIKAKPEAKEEAPVAKAEEKTEAVAEVKPEETPVDEAKAEVAPEKEKAPLIKEVKVIKKTGLRIVKKKKPKPVVIDTSAQQTAYDKNLQKVSSYGKMSAEAMDELNNKKAKKANGGPAQKQSSGKKMDIFGGAMSDVSMDYEEDQVVLLDLTDISDKKPEPEAPRKPRPKKPQGRNGNVGANKRPRNVRKTIRRKYAKDAVVDEVITHVEIPEDIRVYEFAEKLNRTMSEVIKVLFDLGKMATKNDFLSKDEIEILAEEFEVEVTTIDPKDAFNLDDTYDMANLEDDSDEEGMQERPPVITIMGHVDHGKTSLLDAIREAKVVDGEAGGITQHIGAYTVEQQGKMITFIDTPGHAAFSAMRERGAEATDIIIIVVAADDGVKPQTQEAIDIVKKAKVPVIVAINKMDKETANPDQVKGQMAEKDMTPVDWGGDVEFVEVSAKSGLGLDALLENILVQAEILELKANPDTHAKAVVVESSLEKGRGPVATVIVQNGTLKVGDNVVCGGSYGRVKALIDNHKKMIKTVAPSMSAVVVGLNTVPASGETLIVMHSDKEAKEMATKRAEYDRHKELSASTKTTLDELTALIAEGNLKSLKVVLKTDVHGSLEAIKSSLTELRNDEVKIEVISSGVGGITENDVELVNNSENCVLLGFNVRPTGSVNAKAKQRGVEIRTYSIIYQLLDDMTALLTGMMDDKYTENNTGQADVKEVFKIPKGMVAGCMVVDGKLVRGGLVRVIREGVVIFEGELTSLKRFKDDVKEVGNGYECGVVLEGYTDVVPGDVIETFSRDKQKAAL